MWFLDLPFFVFFAIIAQAHCAPNQRPHIQQRSLFSRSIIADTDLSASYDFVIAGGGLAGLVLASRLSENPGNTVLVLEAGESGDAAASQIDIPDGTYFSSVIGSSYDWQHVTVPQTNLSNRVVGWPRGKLLGGSSAINAMYLVRPSSLEMDAWATLSLSNTNDTSAANRWNWANMYAAMKKSENFTPPSSSVQSVVNISYDASTHGSGGPMQVSYPAMMINIVANWTSALAGAGIPTLEAPNGGVTMGAFITPSSINPANWTRSYSRSAYIDPLPPRSNLHILPGATVTRLLFSDSSSSSSSLTANAVEFMNAADNKLITIGVRREVTLAGGSLGSPKILLHSGVGPKDVLDAAGVPLKLELPGVGQHLQDHMTAGVVWQTPLETAGDIYYSGSDFSKTPEFQSFINDAVAFVNNSALFGFTNDSATFQAAVQAALDDSASSLVPTQYPEVVQGYKAVYNLTAQIMDQTAQLELLLSVISPGTVSIQAAIQHPFSRGRLYINTNNPLDPIVVDPQYYSHFADVVMMREGVKLARNVGVAFGTTLGAEITPGPDVQSDEQIEAWLRGSGASTQYHPAGSCSMLPKELGGVVNADLQVHGTANVRIADSSIYPFEFAAHLGSATYGVAEQAAVIIQSNAFTVPSASHLMSSSTGQFVHIPWLAITPFIVLLCLVGQSFI